MCACMPSLKPFLQIAWLLLLANVCLAQQPVPPSATEASRFAESKLPALKKLKPIQSAKPAAPEICTNSLDDDGNGLIDMKDFTCYYSSLNATCLVSKVVWSVTSGGLLWADMETGTERFVGTISGIRMADLAWSSAGKLYGVTLTSNAVYEIDPYTSTPSFAGVISPYFTSNAMTADASGNLFLAASNATAHDIIKLNIASGQVTKVADLRALGLVSAGDLTFLNGFLYLTCAGSQMAKINTATGQIQVIASPFFTTGAYGMFTMGDGYLYLGVASSIYKMDPVTMVADNSPYYVFITPGAGTLGFSNYTEQCNAPPSGCRAVVDIDTLTAAPYCASTGVFLKVKGSGITGTAAFKWTLPDGSTTTKDTLTARLKGWYKVRYYTVPDTCGKDDSVYLDIKKTPLADIGPDTVICPGTQVRFEQKDKQNIDAYLWQDGSTQSFFIATQPGRYTLQVSNACGTSTDTVDITIPEDPQVNLGADKLICNYESIQLKNALHKPGYRYKWQNGSTDVSFTPTQPGIYWLDVSNSCFTVRDSVTVQFKTQGCDRNILFPSAFSPNNDKNNETYRPIVHGVPSKYELVIYNRWGQVVFRTNDPSRGWDGTIRGAKQNTGVFVWTCTYQFSGQEIQFRKGTLTLVR